MIRRLMPRMLVPRPDNAAEPSIWTTMIGAIVGVVWLPIPTNAWVRASRIVFRLISGGMRSEPGRLKGPRAFGERDGAGLGAARPLGGDPVRAAPGAVPIVQGDPGREPAPVDRRAWLPLVRRRRRGVPARDPLLAAVSGHPAGAAPGEGAGAAARDR